MLEDAGRLCPYGCQFGDCRSNPPASPWALSRARRCMDVSVALAALTTFALPMLALAAVIRLTSRGRALFSQQRVGRGGQLFRIFKFRSMKRNAQEDAPLLVAAEDGRVTPLGRLLRRVKADELPQLYNVLRGDMALVGPRPKLPRYAEIFAMPYRPGLTGAATLIFHAEEEMLRAIDEPCRDEFYARAVKPLKTRLDLCYMCRATFASDCRVLLRTARNCVRCSRGVPGSQPLIPVEGGEMARGGEGLAGGASIPGQ